MDPKKTIFGVDKGKLLGHIVSKKRISIDPKKVESINKIWHTTNNKSFQLFLGKINFIRRFIPNFTEFVKQLNSILKKDIDYTWNQEIDRDLNRIKEVITISLVLISLYYSKDFIIFSFASNKLYLGFFKIKKMMGLNSQWLSSPRI